MVGRENLAYWPFTWASAFTVAMNCTDFCGLISSRATELNGRLGSQPSLQLFLSSGTLLDAHHPASKGIESRPLDRVLDLLPPPSLGSDQLKDMFCTWLAGDKQQMLRVQESSGNKGSKVRWSSWPRPRWQSPGHGLWSWPYQHLIWLFLEANHGGLWWRVSQSVCLNTEFLFGIWSH